jgi:hypothetical protein
MMNRLWLVSSRNKWKLWKYVEIDDIGGNTLKYIEIDRNKSEYVDIGGKMRNM